MSTENTNVKNFGTAVTRLINKENMNREEIRDLFYQMLANEQPDMQQGALLAALAAKGETIEEIAGSWEAIYELDTVKITLETGNPPVDNCGTGMDSVKTFNISTAASIIAAAGGITMAKHGARAITSPCGTVDILEELGVDVDCNPEVVKKSVEKAGIGIFNGTSQKIHPGGLGRILSQISFGTILNTAASLANPALPRHGVRGVYSREMLQSVPRVMGEIGYKKALVVHGLAPELADNCKKGQEVRVPKIKDLNERGMDEASTLGETLVAELKENGDINYYSFLPEDMGLKRAGEKDLRPCGDRKIEAERLVRLLKGEENGARQDIACLNAALVLYLMKAAETIKEGVNLSRDLINSGKAMDKLEEWVAEQNLQPEKGLKIFEALAKNQ